MPKSKNHPMKNDSGEHIGHRIKRAMDAANMGPKAVADHFGIKPPSVSDWIKFGRIDKSRVRGLVELFGHTPGYWLDGIEDPPVAHRSAEAHPQDTPYIIDPSPSRTIRERRGREWLDAGSWLTDDERREIIDRAAANRRKVQELAGRKKLA